MRGDWYFASFMFETCASIDVRFLRRQTFTLVLELERPKSDDGDGRRTRKAIRLQDIPINQRLSVW